MSKRGINTDVKIEMLQVKNETEEDVITVDELKEALTKCYNMNKKLLLEHNKMFHKSNADDQIKSQMKAYLEQERSEWNGKMESLKRKLELLEKDSGKVKSRELRKMIDSASEKSIKKYDEEHKKAYEKKIKDEMEAFRKSVH